MLHDCTSKYRHLSGLDLADSSTSDGTAEIDVLIGSDHYWDFVTSRVRRGDSGHVAIYTKLSWILSGATPTPADVEFPANFLVTHTLRTDAENLDETLRTFWDLETLGIRTDEQSVLEEFSQKIQFKEGRYEVRLPWKDPRPSLPTNYELSHKRLLGLLRRLREQPQVLQEYSSIIKGQLERGIVEEVREPEAPVKGTVHYLPHHAVVRSDKQTTKVRIVYDASARSTGCSLNDCLHVGMKFDQRILDILLRFRTNPVALAADIEKAFLMVSIAEEDRDALRFLWVNNAVDDPPIIRVLRFTRVVFGVTSSPFLLNATLQHHLNKHHSEHPELVDRLLKSIYVDDVICGAPTSDDGHVLYRDSKDLLRKGGFNLRKFITNDQDLQRRIDDGEGTPDSSQQPTDETYTKITLGNTQVIRPGEQKILGIRWNTSSDRLCFNFEEIAQQALKLEPTKRHLVSVVGRFYDPLGFLSPVVIKFKMLFQALCSEKTDWDQLLTGSLLTKWKMLISELQASPTMTMPRYLLDGITGAVKSVCLRGFCDASKRAYAAVVYLLIETSNGYFTQFVISKTRVSPLKAQTIPRLELLSALLLAKLMHSVASSLETEIVLVKPECYSDSKVALYWIVGMDKTWKQFVQHRVDEIRTLLPVDCWRHCPGPENPADLPSRGVSPTELAQSKLWTDGPEWLKFPSSCDSVQDVSMPSECANEMRVADRQALNLLVSTRNQTLEQVMQCENFSTLQRLLNVTSHVLKFLEVLREDAEVLWIRSAQQLMTCSPEFLILQKQLNLIEDEEGLWRCGGHLSNAEIRYDAKHPILLPRSHHLTLLIVRRAHQRVLHNGVKDTLNEVRSKFWIVKGRSFVRAVIHRCVICRRFEARPCLGPPPPPLPRFRVAEEPPFTYTGVDFAGPLFVKTGKAVANRKVWICLYTCCVVRAIHLDIVPDLSTPAFIRSLKRFSARRGFPKRFVSDNGKMFKTAARAIHSLMQHEEVKHYLNGRGAEWTFNIERAPWWGGFFEHMVRMSKRCLKKMIGRAQLTYDELVTALTEVEAVINSRPLTYISTEDLDEPLTPAHLLIGRRLLSLPDHHVREDDFEVLPEHLTRRMIFLNKIIDQFWKRWRKEYLLELREAHRYGGRTLNTSPLAPDDIVLVHDDNRPRGFWRLARVRSLIKGTDGQVRGAVLASLSAGGRRITLRRPLQRLYPVEFTTAQREADQQDTVVDNPVEQVDNLKEKLLTQRDLRQKEHELRLRYILCMNKEKLLVSIMMFIIALCY